MNSQGKASGSVLRATGHSRKIVIIFSYQKIRWQCVTLLTVFRAFKVWPVPVKFFCKDGHHGLPLWIVWCHSHQWGKWQKAEIGKKFDIAASFFFNEISKSRWPDKKIRYCHNIAIPKLCGAQSFPLKDRMTSHIIENGCPKFREVFHTGWMDFEGSENGWLL